MGLAAAFIPLPRKGTETCQNYPALIPDHCFHPTSPQGDGNYLVRGVRGGYPQALSSHFPARGRKRPIWRSPASLFLLTFIPLPRKGTETFVYRLLDDVLAWHFHPTSPQGDGNSFQGRGAPVPSSGIGSFHPTSPQGDGNTLASGFAAKDCDVPRFHPTSPQGDGNWIPPQRH
jgi:hypothetical protein